MAFGKKHDGKTAQSVGKGQACKAWQFGFTSDAFSLVSVRATVGFLDRGAGATGPPVSVQNEGAETCVEHGPCQRQGCSLQCSVRGSILS
jgi:hypothetical protein